MNKLLDAFESQNFWKASYTHSTGPTSLVHRSFDFGGKKTENVQEVSLAGDDVKGKIAYIPFCC